MKAWDPLIKWVKARPDAYELSIEAVDVPARIGGTTITGKKDNLETSSIFRIIYTIGKEIKEKWAPIYMRIAPVGFRSICLTKRTPKNLPPLFSALQGVDHDAAF